MAGLHINPMGLEVDDMKGHDVATIKSVAPQIKTSNDDVGYEQLPDIIASDSDDFLLLSPQTRRTPLAICGMAMRLPGGVGVEDDFWRLLIDKRDACSRVPADRYNVDAFQSDINKSGTIQTTRGYFLNHLDLAHFDASFFSMTRSELEKLDPQHRLLLELTRECLENACETHWRGKDIGCYIGTFGEDWLQMQSRDTLESTSSRITGYGDYLLANRVSYEYDFKGPSITLKTACSSSLTCLDMACKALQAGEITSAIVGGVNLIMSPSLTQALNEQGVLSPNGSSRTFDADVDGYARGEAVNTLYIKRLDDAVRDGNPIRAVIRSTASNFDGKTSGISKPSAVSQEALIRACYEAAGLHDFGETAFVECHGTGTAIGDPLEATAVANVFGEKGVYIGSVKPNIGHSEGAAGLSSVIKTVLALENRTIPPNIKFDKPNPRIPFKRGRLRVPVDATPWPADRYERASVNSFGIGGANCHVILDSAASFDIGKSQQSTASTSGLTSRLLVVTANTVESGRAAVKNCQQYVKSHPTTLEDVAFTLGARREHLPYRSFAVTDSLTLPTFSATCKAPKVPPDLVFVFTGQGAQWATMGTSLISDFPTVLGDFELMDKTLSKLPEAPAWTVQGELRKTKETSRINKAEFSQPLCTAIQIVVVNLLRRWGIVPAAVVGHSSGEIAAAYACGALTLQEAIVIAYLRGLAFTKQQIRPGVMAAVGLGREAVRPYLVNGVHMACENSPASITLSGDTDKVNAIVEKIKHDFSDVFVRLLQVEMAFHSPHMKEAGMQFGRMIGHYVSSQAPAVPFFSSQKNERIQRKHALDAAYWQSSYENPVLFHTAVENMLATRPLNSAPLLLEIGPHSALAGPIRQILKANRSDASYIPTLMRYENDTHSMLNAAGQIFLKGLKLDFRTLNPGGRALTNLPHYPWHHETRYWYESRLSKQWRLRSFPRHDLLGSQVPESSDLEPIWRNLLHLDDVPWCRDHVIAGDIVFPAAGYIAMAGEAIRQVSGMEAQDYTLRDFSLRVAMTLHESAAIETIFTMRPFHVTTSLDSAWYEFTVMSYNGAIGTWTKHCAGQVRTGSEYPAEPESIVNLPRKVQSASWYRLMRKVGMSYGPCFQGLENISAHPVHHLAFAHVSNTTSKDDSIYQLHPTAIDSCIQLFTAASCRGQAKSFSSVPFVPTRFGEIYVKRPSAKIAVKVNAEFGVKGDINGSCFGIAANEPVLLLKDVKLLPLGDSNFNCDKDTHAGVCVRWKPDIEFQELRTLISSAAPGVKERFPALERLVLLCCIEARERLTGRSADAEHMNKFFTWLSAEIDRAAAKEYLVDSHVEKLLKLSSPERSCLIAETAAQVRETRASAAGIAVCRILDAIEDIFCGKVEPLELLGKDDILSRVYMFNESFDNCRRFFQLLSHSNPHLKILEIGVGTEATTAKILESLTSEYGERMFNSYTVTDASENVLKTTEHKFKNAQGMGFLPLDINQDPVEQGFVPGSYDLVITTNILHLTESLGKTLANVRRLLRPNGKLLLQQPCSTTAWINFIMGVLPSRWLDGSESLALPDRWNEELSKAGFVGAEAIVFDDDIPYQTSATIITSPQARYELAPTRLSLLSENHKGSVATAVVASLERHGFDVELIGLAEEPMQDVISVLDLEREDPFIAGITPENYALLKDFVARLNTSGILWLTKSCQMNCGEPQYALILGLARTLRNELAVDFATLELDDPGAAEAADAICKVYQKFQHRTKDGDVGPDYEYALAEGAVHIPRFHWISVADGLVISPSEDDTTKRLEIGKRGFLQSLQWVDRPSHANLSGSDVSVKVHAVGMNFKDVLISMGIIEGQKAEGNGLGCECAGVVHGIGPDVQDLKIGDRVCVAGLNTYATILRTSCDNCVKIPDDLSFEDAATMPCAYGTVVHGLLDLAGLTEGQTVLIHSACGGIGIAAINVCRMVGAKIYATVGTQEKVDYLANTFNIPRERIFGSRDSGFLHGLMRETGGKGVDVALNSLSGDLLHATWKCVAEFGSMIEIGKRDFIGQGRLSMDRFEPNRSFFGIDLAHMYVKRPKKIKRILEKMMSFYRQGLIQPIRPTRCFDATQVEDAFRSLQKGQHVGKLVVRIPQDHSLLTTTKSRGSFSLRPDASYLLVGGLGGLGRSVSIWLAEHGARNLIFLSRSGGSNSPETAALVEELATVGCSAQIVVGSVACLDDVRQVTTQARLPVAGVLQMSMVLRDATFSQMAYEDWEAATMPKIQGTWNLHTVFATHSLDFFILFSSISGLVGNPGQANYASANTFLDAFVQFRHNRGLPASVLDVGAMSEVGYLSQNPTIMAQLHARIGYVLQEQDLLDAIELAIKRSSPRRQVADIHTNGYVNESQIGIGLRITEPVSSPDNRAVWKRDIRMALYRNLEATAHNAADENISSAPGNDALKRLLTSATDSPHMLTDDTSVAVIAQHIGATLLGFMMKPVEELDVKASPTALGVDSLIAIELRNWCRQRFGVDVSVLEIMGAASIELLGASVAKGLAVKFAGVEEEGRRVR